MKQAIKFAAFALAIAAASAADASVIQLQTAFSDAGVQASAAAYRSVVDAAVLTGGAGYGSATLSSFDHVLNQSLFGSSNNIAFKSTIDFGVTGAASTWSFRAGVDFGRGGAVYLDGQPVALKTNDMWWAGSYADTTQSFQFSTTLGAGNHTLQIYGLEGCCDGGMQVQYNAGAGFQSFSAQTLTLAPVPEPETYAMMLAGIGFVGFAARRRKA